MAFRLQTTCHGLEVGRSLFLLCCPRSARSHAGDPFRGLLWNLGAEDARRCEGTEMRARVCVRAAHRPGTGSYDLSTRGRGSRARAGHLRTAERVWAAGRAWTQPATAQARTRSPRSARGAPGGRAPTAGYAPDRRRAARARASRP